MEISSSHRKMLTEEIDFAVKKMSETQDASQVMYYFSAIPGILHRILNMEFNPDLLFAHFTLRSTQDAFIGRLNSIKSGDAPFIFDDKQITTLISLCESLSKSLKKKEEITPLLRDFAVLLYSTTGNGFYLMQKGILKI